MARRARPSVLALAVPAVLTFTLAACDPAPSTTSDGTPEPTASSTSPAPARQPDPLVPYSPAPSELVPRVTGYVPETLTLPTSNDARMLVTVTSTAIDTRWVADYRATSVWVMLENPGRETWIGVPAEFAKISDDNGNVFEPVTPTSADLHPDPERYGASNRDLTRSVTLGPGERVDGVIVFHPTGGNRLVTISMSLNGGGVWGEWTTPLGPF